MKPELVIRDTLMHFGTTEINQILCKKDKTKIHTQSVFWKKKKKQTSDIEMW